jgi:hypothetical protein
LGIREDITSLYHGECDIYELDEKRDERGVSTFERVSVQSGVKCRLVFSSREGFALLRNAAQATQSTDYILNVRVFLPPDIYVKAGSIMEVRQNGVSYLLRATAEGARYKYHQEVMAVPEKEEV